METHFRVAVVNFTYLFSVLKLPDDKYVGESGTEFELLEILSKFLNFTYELVCPTDGAWGTANANGSSNGMVGMLQRNEADIALDRISLTYSRSKVVDFAFPYDVDIHTFMIKKAGRLATKYYFVYPFELSIWICIFLSIIVCSPFLLLLRHVSLVNFKSIYVSLVNIASSAEMLIGNGFLTKGFDKVAVRTLFVLWTFPLRVLLFCFTGLLLSFLMTPLMEKQIESFEQLAVESRIGRVKVSAFKGSYSAATIQHPQTKLLADLGTNLRKYPKALAKSPTEEIQMVNGGYAFIGPRYILTTTVHGHGYNIFTSNDGLGISPVSVLFRKKFRFTKNFNKAIIRLQQSYIYQKILNDKIFKLGLKAKLRTNHDHSLRPISIKDLSGVFEILFIGLAISFVVLLFEIITRSKSRHRRFKIKNSVSGFLI